MNKKVAVVLITDQYVEEEVWDALLLQDYPNYQVILSQMKAQFTEGSPVELKYLNCSHHRNQAAKIALETDAEYFLFVDSDTVPPPHAISQLMAAEKDAIGGWYPCINSDRWVAGYWKDDLFFNYRKIEPGVSRVDMLGLGCALLHRKVVEKISFRSGLDIECRIAYVGKGIAGECSAFGIDCQKEGFELFMHGDVICRHLHRTERNPKLMQKVEWKFYQGGKI